MVPTRTTTIHEFPVNGLYECKPVKTIRGNKKPTLSVLTSYKSIGAADLSKVVEAGDGEGDV